MEFNDNNRMDFKHQYYNSTFNNEAGSTGWDVQPTYKIRKKSNWKAYLSIIVITSMINTAILGGVFYFKFLPGFGSNSTAQQYLTPSSISSPGSSQSNSGGMMTASTGDNVYSAVDIAKKVGPSIVGIRVTTASSRNSFFGASPVQSQVEGSGIIISKDGYIATNYHVVGYADPKSSTGSNSTVEVFLSDNRQAKAAFIGGDSDNDLAVIKINLDNLPVASFGDSASLQVGEPAVAIGNPLGMEFAGSVTVGVISALNREVQADDKTLNLIQTDAAINPGNSGGALVNSQGLVIGINTMKISETGVEGLGFAIPVNDAKPIIDQLISYGYVKGKPVIGISGQEISEVLSQQYNLPVGIYIVSVSPGSGAEKAGIKKGDVLISLAGKDVKTMADIDSVKKNYKAGDTVDAVLVTNGVKRTIKLTFSEAN